MLHLDISVFYASDQSCSRFLTNLLLEDTQKTHKDPEEYWETWFVVKSVTWKPSWLPFKMPSRPANPSMLIKPSNLHEPFSLPGEKVTDHSHFPGRAPCSSFACKKVLKLSSVLLTSYEPLTITSRGIPGNKSVLLLHHPPFTFLICFFHAGSLQESLIYSWIPGTWEPRKALLCGRPAASALAFAEKGKSNGTIH